MQFPDSRPVEAEDLHQDLIGVLAEQRGRLTGSARHTCHPYGSTGCEMPPDAGGLDLLEDRVGFADPGVSLTTT